MIRTQIHLPKPLYEDIKLRAKIAGKPAAEVLRDFVYKGIAAGRQQPKRPGGLTRLANLNVTGGPADLAAKLDDYLYGQRA
jgi:hypothetical protein